MRSAGAIQPSLIRRPSLPGRLGLRWWWRGINLAELGLLALAVVYLLPFVSVLGPVANAAKLLRWPALAAVAAWLFLGHREAGASLGFPIAQRILFAWIGMAAISSFWSPTPNVSLMKVIALALTVATVHIAAVRSMVPLRWVRLMAWLALILTILTLPSAMLSESIAEEYYRTAGFIESGPNAVGAVGTMALALLLPFGVYYAARRNRLWTAAIVAAVLGVVFVLFATGSRSAAGAALGAVVVWGFSFPREHLRLLFKLSLALVAGLALLAMTDFVQTQAAYLTRERGLSIETFESRREIWREALESSQQRPLFGYGYGASGLTRDVSGVQYQAFTIRDGSGYFGLLESLGWTGMVLFSAFVLAMIGPFRRLSRLPADSLVRAGGLAACVCFAALVLNQVGEPWLLGPGSPMNLIFWLTSAAALVLASGAHPAVAGSSRSTGAMPPRLLARLRRNRELQHPASGGENA
ncbi:O-antigen ligase family protein [bacterium]|nr:O-antigen ligase family protein [bacterium]